MNGLRRWLQARKGLSAVEKPGQIDRYPAGVKVSSDELIALRLQTKGLKLASRRSVSSVIAGAHGSRFRGRGMDYQESRNYQAGDDVRNMDWRVTARTGEAHTKIYQEERERPVVLLLDLSPSMFFGTRSAFKSVLAARVAAFVAWVTVANGDRIGALLFNGGHQEIKTRGGYRGALGLIRHLVEATDPLQGINAVVHPDGLNGALRRLRRVVRPGSLIFMISDFYAMDQETGKQLLRLRRHNDLIAIQVADALELAPPPPGRYGITDGLHTGMLDTRGSARQQEYRDWFEHHHQAVRELAYSHALPLLRLSTSDRIVDALRPFLTNPRASTRQRSVEAVG